MIDSLTGLDYLLNSTQPDPTQPEAIQYDYTGMLLISRSAACPEYITCRLITRLSSYHDALVPSVIAPSWD